MALDLPNGSYHTVRLILGDQLHAGHSWFKNTDDTVLYVLSELHQETGYVKHHVQKLCAFFIAMRGFAEALSDAGHHVAHFTLDDTASFDDLPALLQAICAQCKAEHFEYQRPDEYRLLAQLQDMDLSSVTKTECDSEHFLLPFEELEQFIDAGKHNRMESFYRKMRQRTGWLMDGDKPVGEQWNYDAENRNKLKAKDLDAIPAPLCFAHETESVVARLDKHKVSYFGEVEEKLVWPCTRQEARELTEFFCAHCLPDFGRFQDAMTGKSEYAWSLYHSRLSFALNAKLITPRYVIETALAAYDDNDDIDLAQIEGFIRQILGWREYVRGVYWMNIPHYREQNHFSAERALPEFFWTGDTNMRCLQQAISQSLKTAYAHHIQRLMVTGNFCLLCDIDPDAVDDWYLGIYIDAIEWVEMPNTRGMALFADGGWIATKPYSASGNYINKMSDYCRDCHYDVKKSTGDDACPFNSLYWRFMTRHRDSLSNNPRIGMLFGNWDKREEKERKAILDRAEWCVDHLDAL